MGLICAAIVMAGCNQAGPDARGYTPEQAAKDAGVPATATSNEPAPSTVKPDPVDEAMKGGG